MTPAYTIIIEKAPEGKHSYGFRLRVIPPEGMSYLIEHLAWDEMLGAVAYMTCPKGPFAPLFSPTFPPQLMKGNAVEQEATP